jgi:hypothetical protein
MIVGLAAMLVVWAATPIAWTWYVFIGMTVTVAVAWTLSFVVQESPQTQRSAQPQP